MGSLRAQLERMADLSDATALDEPVVVRGRGERRRRHNRLATFAVLLLAVMTGSALTYQLTGQSAGLPADGDTTRDGSAVIHRIPMPNQGMLVHAAGSLWVVDEGDGTVSLSDGPDGSLVQVDPASGVFVSVTPHAVGGWPVAGEGALWLSTQRMNELTRVDLRTREVRRRVTSAVEPGLATVQVAHGSVWVANTNAGTVGQLDPQSLRLLKEIPVGPGPYASATDGRYVWFSLFDTNEVVRVDAATGTVASRMVVGRPPIRALAVSGSSLFVSDVTTLHEVDVSDVGSERVVRSLALTGSAGRAGPGAASMRADGGYVWVLRTAPNQLLRIDPDRLTVSRRIPLPSTPTTDDVIGLATGEGRVWVSLTGEVIEVKAD